MSILTAPQRFVHPGEVPVALLALTPPQSLPAACLMHGVTLDSRGRGRILGFCPQDTSGLCTVDTAPARAAAAETDPGSAESPGLPGEELGRLQILTAALQGPEHRDAAAGQGLPRLGMSLPHASPP